MKLVDLMNQLLNSNWHQEVCDAKPYQLQMGDDNKFFNETFKDATMYFTQFIKVHDPDVIHHNFLWMAITRGTAIMCKDNQCGINLVIHFLYWDTLLHRTNVSAILAQVKNDTTYMNVPRLNLLHGINPFKLWFFNDDEKHLVPII